jgi:RimJ/RimL family protein N-acetyltransferase
MVLKNAQIQLVSTTEEDKEFNQLFSEYSELQNLSELRLHPHKLPQVQYFRIELEDKLIGEIGFKSIRWYNRKAEIFLAIKKEYHCKGIGRKVLKMIIEYGFDTMNFHRLEAEVVSYNEAAQKLFTGFGFRQEGIFKEAKYFNGKYYDILCYGLLRKEKAKHFQE